MAILWPFPREDANNHSFSLRRAHFFPRKRGRKPKSESEKRGGKGGGKDPPIEFLKANWMREMEEVVHLTQNVDNDDDAAPEDEPMEESEPLSSHDDQPSTSFVDVSYPDDFVWQNDAYQYATATAAADGGYADPQDYFPDIASDPSFTFDVPSSQHAFTSPELEVLQLEESYRWQ